MTKDYHEQKYGWHLFDWVLVGGLKVCAKNPWKAISPSFPFFFKFLRCYVGMGLIPTYGWGDKPIYFLFSSLYHLSGKRLHSVASVMESRGSASSFSLGLKRPLTA